MSIFSYIRHLLSQPCTNSFHSVSACSWVENLIVLCFMRPLFFTCSAYYFMQVLFFFARPHRPLILAIYSFKIVMKFQGYGSGMYARSLTRHRSHGKLLARRSATMKGSFEFWVCPYLLWTLADLLISLKSCDIPTEHRCFQHRETLVLTMSGGVAKLTFRNQDLNS